ncbi:uncharacterized protein BCR38DRAFT_410560 [Pseudomassariella vexata]|uniref:NAD-dependent epimerase/dehydratase domain-containing protein n=1 Tax=Pseudomassariella vexata TaxID=1141098 RepID=A0A1Y2DU05_9PEZI|nr:uncharacterized protein BCR38DRAFT_410560 [Pseudomassariella vexata]ORY62115.1 hypothetical protein BCR38DRAFT_410560 [Pseudomassariella vexata]
MGMLDNKDLVLAKGSQILVTGSNGYVASNIVREALDAGYKVRGTCRSQDKVTRTKQTFNHPDYAGVVVENLADENAFDEAVKGADAIIHCATIFSLDPNPHNVVLPVVNGVIGILNAALKEPSVSRFVYTSSCSACTSSKPNTKLKIDRSTWNTELEKYADLPPPYTPDIAPHVYALSKMRAETAVWNFVKEKKPHFVVNSIVPSYNVGRIIDSPGLSGQLVIDIYQGKMPWYTDSEHVINVVDCARLHVAATIDGSVVNERVLAFHEPFNWNDVIEVIRELKPDAKVVDIMPDLPRVLSEVDNALGAELLRKWWGQKGYTGLKESIRQNIEGLA